MEPSFRPSEERAQEEMPFVSRNLRTKGDPSGPGGGSGTRCRRSWQAQYLHRHRMPLLYKLGTNGRQVRSGKRCGFSSRPRLDLGSKA